MTDNYEISLTVYRFNHYHQSTEKRAEKLSCDTFGRQNITSYPSQILTMCLQTSVCVTAGTWQSVSWPVGEGGQMDDVVLGGMKEAWRRHSQPTAQGHVRAVLSTWKKERRQGDLRHQQQNLNNHLITNKHTPSHTNTNIISRTNTLTDKTRRVSLRKCLEFCIYSFCLAQQWSLISQTMCSVALPTSLISKV